MTEKNLLLSRRKSIFSQKVALEMYNAVWQSRQKISNKKPENFSSMSKSNNKNFPEDFHLERQLDI